MPIETKNKATKIRKLLDKSSLRLENLKDRYKQIIDKSKFTQFLTNTRVTATPEEVANFKLKTENELLEQQQKQI